MDEPTSSLDYGNQIKVLSVVKELAVEGYTVLLSTHNPQHALRYADRVLALLDGRVSATVEGGPDACAFGVAVRYARGIVRHAGRTGDPARGRSKQ